MARSRADRPLFQRGPGLGLRAALIGILAAALWLADQRGIVPLNHLRGSFDWALQPFRWISALPESLGEGLDNFRSNRELVAENQALREAQIKSQAELLRLDALEAENRRIRQLMASSSALQQKVLIAEIIASSQDPYRHQVTLNKGGRDGAYFGQAIVDAYGVMGQIVRVNPTTSIALLVTDPAHGIPVEINRTGLQTVARGGGNGRTLTLPFLPGNADVKVGDLLVSSGLGGRFPAGYPVGEIFDVRKTTGEHFMEATAYPSARLNQGRQALLVWSEQPAPPAAEEPQMVLEAAAHEAALAAQRRAPAHAAAKPDTTAPDVAAGKTAPGSKTKPPPAKPATSPAGKPAGATTGAASSGAAAAAPATPKPTAPAAKAPASTPAAANGGAPGATSGVIVPSPPTKKAKPKPAADSTLDPLPAPAKPAADPTPSPAPAESPP